MKRVAAIVVAGATLTGCGSSERPRPAQPKLPALVARQLAARSDRVAAALNAGDACTALDEARRLQQEALDAINAGRIPGPFQEELGSAVGDLVGRIECVPPEKEHGHGKGKRKGKHGEGD